jgi:hypothetical protein
MVTSNIVVHPDGLPVKSAEPLAGYSHSFSFLSIAGDRDPIKIKDLETIGELV